MKGIKGMEQEDIEERILEAMRLNGEGRLEELEPVVLGLVADLPEETGITAVLLATYLRRLGRFEESIEIFERLLKMEPFSERASMGLFHSLWSAQRFSEAFDELERYLTHRAAEAHVLLLLDWKKDFGNEIPERFIQGFPNPEIATKEQWLKLLAAFRAIMEPGLAEFQDK